MKSSKSVDKIAALEKENELLREEIEKARLSEKRFLDALRLSPMALCHHDKDLRYTWLYNGHMGFVQDEVIGLTDWDILDKDLADRMGEIKRRVLETGVGERVEMPTVSGDENSEYFDLVVEPLRDVNGGDVVGLSCSGIDVTQDRRRREAYKASEENLRFIFNASPMPIVVTRMDDSMPLFFNQAADDMLCFAICDNLFDWINLNKDARQELRAKKSLNNFKFEFVNTHGEKLYLSLSCTQIFYDGHAAVLSTFHDLTQEAHYQKTLEDAKEKAESASLAKSHFLAAASHDLRQPLHAMGLLLSVLEQYIQEPSGLNVLERINGSLEAMNELFAGILDISKLDARAVAVKMEPVSVARCFETLEQEFSTVAQSKNLDIKFVGSSLSVYADMIQFERILRNLIANALRYTPSGRILVGARRQQGRLRFYVYDTGIGIAPKDQEVIFQEFRQIGNPERDRRKGLGLGLAICERISNLLNTRIEVSSIVGKGSVFSFDLPICDGSQNQKTDSQLDETVIVGKRILFVEDELDVQVATRYMLEAWGCKPIIAGSMQEASTLCAQEGCVPDAIVVDYRLRENETGLDVVLELRKQWGEPIPAIVLSGDTAPELIRRLEGYGLTLLTKPVLPKELRQVLTSSLTL